MFISLKYLKVVGISTLGIKDIKFFKMVGSKYPLEKANLINKKNHLPQYANIA